MKSLPLGSRRNRDDLSPPITSVPGGVHLAVRVIPRAGRTQITGIRHGALLVRLAAAPHEGAANEALIKFISSVLGIRRGAVELISGDRSRDKRLAIDGITLEKIRESLERLLTQGSGRDELGRGSTPAKRVN